MDRCIGSQFGPMTVSLRWVHVDLFLQVNTHGICAYVHLMDLEIVLGGDRECQPTVAHPSSLCVYVAW